MRKLFDPGLAELFSLPQTINSEIQGQSDQGAAVVAGSILDAMLEILIRGVLVQDINLQKEIFLGERGPLSTFSAKIKIAYALGLISKIEKNELEIIRGIRNDFAHTLEKVTFEDQSIQDRCKNLVLPVKLYLPDPLPQPEMPSAPIPAFDLTPPVEWHPRTLFSKSVELLTSTIAVRYAEEYRECNPPKEFESQLELLSRFRDKVRTILSEREERVRQLSEESNDFPLLMAAFMQAMDKVVDALARSQEEKPHSD